MTGKPSGRERYQILSVEKVEESAEDVTHDDQMVVTIYEAPKMIFTRKILTSSVSEGWSLTGTV